MTMPLQPGARLGAYRIVRQLDSGGMGIVYEAVHEELKQTRALKVFHTESSSREFLRERFLREGQILSRFSSPRIVKVYDLAVDAESGTPYFAMDYVCSPSGSPRTLDDVREEGSASQADVAGWFRDVCEGLAYIHSQGVVHRDISLENVLIGPDGHAVLADFGIARIVGDELRQQIDVTKLTMAEAGGVPPRMGKRPYMAPELTRRVGASKATPESDAWALGVMLFRLLTNVWYEPKSDVIELVGDGEYAWDKVILLLCNSSPALRLPPGGIGAVPALLRRRVWWRSPWLRRGAAALGLAALVSAALAFGPWKKTSPAKHGRNSDAPHILPVSKSY